MPSVQANSITIEYDERGSGDPLLLVMGLGGQLTDWSEELLDVFVERGFRVIRFDNRDIGLSTEFGWEPATRQQIALARVARRRPDAGYLIDDMADDAAHLLDALAIESAHVLGVSMGGMISQALAIRHPAKVRSLTSIMSNTGDRKNGMTAPKLLAKLARLPLPTPENAIDLAVASGRVVTGPAFDEDRFRAVVEASYRRSFRPAGAARQLTAILASPDRTSGLGTVTAPTLVVHGLLDRLVLPTGGIATAAAVPGSRLVMYPEMGHDIPRPRLGELADDVRRTADRA